MEELERLAQKYSLQNYHVAYLERFMTLCDVRGKDVLEVGGAMPREIALDFLGARSWTALESMAYHGHDGILNQRDRLERQNVFSSGGLYRYYSQNVENLSEDHHNAYDLIFSIACFEHIHRLPLALDVMLRVLRPGGELFSLFAPVWSSMIGAHLSHVKLPTPYCKDNAPEMGLFLEP
jgi:SAM-dependent methyltransferase